MKVAVLGPQGTFTHQAAEEYFEEYEPIFCHSIKEAMESESDYTVVPFENSLGGGVTESLDIFREREDISIVGEKVIPIRHFLVSGENSLEDIDTVRSHPQALGQCREFLSQHGWVQKEDSSTARAAGNLGEGEAAIASRLAAELNDLQILEENIQDNMSNETRFFILGPRRRKDPDNDTTSLLLLPEGDRPGLLQSMLSCFSGHGINLSHIQSRPTKKKLGDYFFYVEAEIGDHQKSFKRATRCLETYCDIKLLGSYVSDR